VAAGSSGDAVREFVVRAQGGDRDAFSELVAVTVGRLTAVARMILRDEYAAQDAVQEAYVRAWRSLPGLRDPDAFDGWIRQVLVRQCYEAGRRRKRAGTSEIRLTPDAEPVIHGAEWAVGVHDQLERGLARIPTEQRVAIVLVYYLDLPLADAAQAMGVPVGTAKSRVSRAIQALRAAIDADDREPAPVREGIAS
jgi:RNA polymerase sigma-70 factor (ECF subfamily)